MSRDSILKIRETEEAAAKAVEDAKQRARQIVERAEQDGRALCASTEAEATAQHAAILDQVKEKLLVLDEKNKAEIEEELAGLCREVQLRRRIAEKIIIRGLETKCR